MTENMLGITPGNYGLNVYTFWVSEPLSNGHFFCQSLEQFALFGAINLQGLTADTPTQQFFAELFEIPEILGFGCSPQTITIAVNKRYVWDNGFSEQFKKKTVDLILRRLGWTHDNTKIF
jgi:hypothetical protein